MKTVIIRHVEKFPEPDFSPLSRVVFEEVQQPSLDLASALADESSNQRTRKVTQPPMYRLGAYQDEELVGWSCGWMERGNIFYMANSGVISSHRRRGIYSALLKSVQEYALSQGAVAIRSQHSVLNNSVIIAKLRSGFHISGLSQSAHMGTLVELILHFSEKRSALFRSRSIPPVPSDA